MTFQGFVIVASATILCFVSLSISIGQVNATNRVLQTSTSTTTSTSHLLSKPFLSDSLLPHVPWGNNVIDNDHQHDYPIKVNVQVSIHQHYNFSFLTKCHIDPSLALSPLKSSSPTIKSRLLMMMDNVVKKEIQEQQQTWTVTVYTLEEKEMLKNSIKRSFKNEDYSFYENRLLPFATTLIPTSTMNKSCNNITSISSDKNNNAPANNCSSYDIKNIHSIISESTVQFHIPTQKTSLLQSTQHQQQQNQYLQTHQNNLIIFIQLSKLLTKNQKQKKIIIKRTMQLLRQNNNNEKTQPMIVRLQFDHEESIHLDNYNCNHMNITTKLVKHYDTEKILENVRREDLKSENVTTFSNYESFNTLVQKWSLKEQCYDDSSPRYEHKSKNSFCISKEFNTVIKKEKEKSIVLDKKEYEIIDNNIIIREQPEVKDPKDTSFIKCLNYFVMFLCMTSVILSCLICYLHWEFVCYLFIHSLEATIHVRKIETGIKVDHNVVKKETSETNHGDCIKNSFSSSCYHMMASSTRKGDQPLIIIYDSDDDDNNDDDRMIGLRNDELLIPPIVQRKYNPDLFPSNDSHYGQSSMSTSCSNVASLQCDDRSSQSEVSTQLVIATGKGNTQQISNDTFDKNIEYNLDKKFCDGNNSANEMQKIVESNASNADFGKTQQNADKFEQESEFICFSNNKESHTAISDLDVENTQNQRQMISVSSSQSDAIAAEGEITEVSRTVDSKRKCQKPHQNTPDTHPFSNDGSPQEHLKRSKETNIELNKDKTCLDDIKSETKSILQNKHSRLSITRTRQLRQEMKEHERKNSNPSETIFSPIIESTALKTQDSFNASLLQDPKKNHQVKEERNQSIRKEIKTNFTTSDGSDCTDITYLDEKKLSLLPPPMYSNEKKVSFIPPPPATKFMPSSELLTVSKAVQSPVWEFKSSISSTKRPMTEKTEGLSEKKKNRKHHKSPSSSANKVTLQFRTNMIRTRSRTRSMRSSSTSTRQDSIPRTIVVTSDTQEKYDGFSQATRSNSKDIRRKRKRGENTDEVDKFEDKNICSVLKKASTKRSRP